MNLDVKAKNLIFFERKILRRYITVHFLIDLKKSIIGILLLMHES